MVSELVTQIFAFGHVLSAMGWLGGGMFTALALGPNLRKMSQGASLEFNAKVLPNLMRFVQVSIGSTILFGLLLLYAVSNGDMSYFSTTQGEVSVGIVLALVTAIIAWSVTIPSFKKVSRAAAAALGGSQQGPPTEMMTYAKRARQGSMVGVILLIITLAMMVAAGF
jgi:uncharacterized membrane protein